MVEVFKTNVHEPGHAAELVEMLHRHFPGGRINFDLEDCDRILRVEKADIIPDKIIALLTASGFECSVLD